MDLKTQPVVRAVSLSTQEAELFDKFKQQCSEQGLLNASVGTSEDDVPDGINDDATLLYGTFLLHTVKRTTKDIMRHIERTLSLTAGIQTFLSCPQTGHSRRLEAVFRSVQRTTGQSSLCLFRECRG